jgi:hypothetical protein
MDSLQLQLLELQGQPQWTAQFFKMAQVGCMGNAAQKYYYYTIILKLLHVTLQVQ